MELRKFKMWEALVILCCKCLKPVRIAGHGIRSNGQFFVLVSCHGAQEELDLCGPYAAMMNAILSGGDRFRDHPELN